MRKIIITEGQADRLSGALLKVRRFPDFLMDAVKGNATPIGDCKYIYGNFIENSLRKRYEEILGFFNDDISEHSNDEVYSKLSKLFSRCMKKEEPIKDNLQSICYNKIVEKFEIPDGAVNLECSIAEIPQGARLHIKPDTDEAEYDSVDAIESNDLDIAKRKIINMMIYGCSYRLTEEIMSELVNDIFSLDEELPHLYSQIMKINDYLVFVSNVKIEDKDHKQGGTVEVKLAKEEDEIPTIKATGMILPILIHETISGLIELIATNGLPDDKESARRILNVSDAIENEPWVMRLGQAFWDPISGETSISTDMVPHIMLSLSCMDSERFMSLIREMTAGTRKWRNEISSILSQAEYNKEYSDFETDLATKRKENVIADSYFTEEELMGELCNG